MYIDVKYGIIPILSLIILLVDAGLSSGQTGPPDLDSTTVDTVENRCHHERADLVFLLDESGSMGRKQFHDILEFIASLLTRFEIGPSTIQVGLVKFSQGVFEVFPLGYHKNSTALLSGIASIRYVPGRATRTDLALNFARRTSFSQKHGARLNTPNIAIVITDGRSTYKRRTLQEVDLAKKAGIVLFAIGIGRAVNENELRGIATEPSAEHAMLVKDIKGLNFMTDYIANLTCKDVEKATSQQARIYSDTGHPTFMHLNGTKNHIWITNQTQHWYSNLALHPAYIILVVVAIAGFVMIIGCAAVAFFKQNDSDDKKPLLKKPD